jgi:CTP synthase (UTP-ammonia lyase)
LGKTFRIGIIGDYNPDLPSHVATNEALKHAADSTRMPLEFEWLSTQPLAFAEGESVLEQFDGLWASPGSPYQSMEGALRAIQFARERDWPFTGT